MEANFDKILKHVLMHEGGYVDHPRDPGGVTNLGVTKRVWESWLGHPVTNDEMRALTPTLVRPLYKQRYWDRVKGDDLPSGVDYSVFDYAVNSGPVQAGRSLQRIVGTAVDGQIGPLTLKEVRRLPPTDLIKQYNDARLAFLKTLPTWTFFGRGWGNRVADVRHTSLQFAAQR